MAGLLYTVFIGIPLCLLLCTIGLMFLATIIGAPVGLTLIALGFKSLTLSPTRRVVVR